jgi:hypothetical protein
VLSLSLILSPTFELWNGVTLAAQAEAACKTSSLYSIYDMDSGFVPNAKIASCSGIVHDATDPPNNLRVGTVLAINVGWFEDNRKLFLFRGKPNQAYPPTGEYIGDVWAKYVNDSIVHALANDKYVLPFQPSEIYDLGEVGNIPHLYGYSGLIIPSSTASAASPLNSHSIIIGIDGYGFATPESYTAVAASINADTRPSKYVDVSFFQSDEKVQAVRHALIPVTLRNEREPEWSRLSASNHLFDKDNFHLVKVAAVFLLLAGAAKAFSETVAWENYVTNRQKCLADPRHNFFSHPC